MCIPLFLRIDLIGSRLQATFQRKGLTLIGHPYPTSIKALVKLLPIQVIEMCHIALEMQEDLHTLISWLLCIEIAMDGTLSPSKSPKTRVTAIGSHPLLSERKRLEILIVSDTLELIKVGHRFKGRTAIHGSSRKFTDHPSLKIYLA